MPSDVGYDGAGLVGSRDNAIDSVKVPTVKLQKITMEVDRRINAVNNRVDKDKTKDMDEEATGRIIESSFIGAPWPLCAR